MTERQRFAAKFRGTTASGLAIARSLLSRWMGELRDNWLGRMLGQCDREWRVCGSFETERARDDSLAREQMKGDHGFGKHWEYRKVDQ